MSNEQLAIEVIAGKWASGEERKRLLTAAGYDFNAVQQIVNAMMAGTYTSPPAESTAENRNLKKVKLDMRKYNGMEVTIIV